MALAEELIGDPAFLLLDELTSGLDAFADREMMQWLTDLAHTHGKTVVLVICVFAYNVEGVKNQLINHEDRLYGLYKFADEHQLAILGWGSTSGLWDARKNWDEEEPDIQTANDREFDRAANGWEEGVQYFIKNYNLPSHGFLLSGYSGAAQYACRIALRKPSYFLAVHIHIPSSFDMPTPDANKVLWCLTTGDHESGYQRSLRFYAKSREMGYPIIYKAIPGLGHQGSPIADQIELKFFEYALNLEAQGQAGSNSLTSADNSVLWSGDFSHPKYVGDIINQDFYPFDQKDLVPEKMRVVLPTKEIADAWND
jgi:predicted esterase